MTARSAFPAPSRQIGSLSVVGTLAAYDSLSIFGTLLEFGSLPVDDAFLCFGSLSELGTLAVVGSLCIIGTLRILGSLFELGTLPKPGSLILLGTLLQSGSLTLFGTHRSNGSLGGFGTLHNTGSLTHSGTLRRAGSLRYFGTLSAHGSQDLLEQVFVSERLLQPNFGLLALRPPIGTGCRIQAPLDVRRHLQAERCPLAWCGLFRRPSDAPRPLVHPQFRAAPSSCIGQFGGPKYDPCAPSCLNAPSISGNAS